MKIYLDGNKQCPRCRQQPLTNLEKLVIATYKRRMKNRRHRGNKWQPKDEVDKNKKKTNKLPWSNTLCVIVGHSFVDKLKQAIERDIRKGLSLTEAMDLKQ